MHLSTIPVEAIHIAIMTVVGITCIVIHNICLLHENKKLKQEPGKFAEWAAVNGYKYSYASKLWFCVYFRKDNNGEDINYTTDELLKLWKKN